MSKKALLAGLVGVAMTTPVAAGELGMIDGYLVNSEIDIDGGGSDDGDGFGVKGAFNIAERTLLTGEFQSAELDDSEIDLDQLRFGVAQVFPGQTGASFFGRGEYVSIEADGDDESGFGVHGGLWLGGQGPLSGYGSIGFLSLDDSDGIEFALGGAFALSPVFSLFIDYRSAGLEDDDSGIEFDVNDLRIGGRYHFNP